ISHRTVAEDSDQAVLGLATKTATLYWVRLQVNLRPLGCTGGGPLRRTFILSDLHLGGDTGFQMCPPRNQAALAALIFSFAQQHRKDMDVQLVLGGDIVDFLAETPYTSFT